SPRRPGLRAAPPTGASRTPPQPPRSPSPQNLLAAGAGTRAGLGLLQQLGDQRFELAAGLDRVELAVGVDDEDGRDRVDPPRPGEVAVPVVALVVLRPGDLILGDELLEAVEPALLLGLVEADADKLD